MENTERERRYKKLQLKLEELQKRRDRKFSRKIGIIAGVLFAAVLFFVGSSFAFYKSDIIFMILISVAFGWCCRLCVTIVFEMSENRIQRKMLISGSILSADKRTGATRFPGYSVDCCIWCWTDWHRNYRHVFGKDNSGIYNVCIRCDNRICFCYIFLPV